MAEAGTEARPTDVLYSRSQVVFGNAIMAQAWLGQINYTWRFRTVSCIDLLAFISYRDNIFCILSRYHKGMGHFVQLFSSLLPSLYIEPWTLGLSWYLALAAGRLHLALGLLQSWEADLALPDQG